MGEAREAPPAQLFAGLLYANISVDPERIYSILEGKLGHIILESEDFPFRETGYYVPEMGENLTRVWLGFDRLIGQETLPGLKHLTNDLEKTFLSKEGKRRVNIDPGYLTLGKVVLASTKNNQHRVYQGGGMYAEVTLRYTRGRYSPWEWTFRDYRREEAARFFSDLRDLYRRKLEEQR
jgi:hypothetical protein